MQNRHAFGHKRIRPAELIAEYGIKAVSFTSFAVIILIFIFVFREAIPLFYHEKKPVTTEKAVVQETYGDDASASDAASGENVPAVSVEDIVPDKKAEVATLTEKIWQPVSSKPKFGILPLVIGSLKVTFLAIFVASPIAILAALFTAFFAPKKIKIFLKPAIEFLAGFPSVVIGFLAIAIFASFFQNLFGYQFRLNAFVGGVALSLAVIPIIYTVTEDALTAIPKYLTEASLALGATRWQTALFVVLPAATPGIFAAILLGIGRAFGETMIVLMATGNAAMISFNFTEPVRTMSATIGAEMAEVVFGDTHYSVLFFIGTLLFIFTFILNAVAEFYVRKKLMKRFQGLS